MPSKACGVNRTTYIYWSSEKLNLYKPDQPGSTFGAVFSRNSTGSVKGQWSKGITHCLLSAGSDETEVLGIGRTWKKYVWFGTSVGRRVVKTISFFQKVF